MAELRLRTERRLAELVPDPGPDGSRAQQAMHYALLSPGRRLRAQLTLVTATCVGKADVGEPNAALNAALDSACALEMVHAASLIMDDLPAMDDTPERRGRPATHVRFGEPVALLATIGLLNGAYAVLAAADLPPTSRLAMVQSLTGAVGLAGLVLGQERDLSGGIGPGTSADTLADIHRRKTGVLFTAAVELGGLAAGASAEEMDVLREFAGHFGIAFQMLDDIDDGSQAGQVGDDERLGRPSAVDVMGRRGAAREVEQRLGLARAALARGGPALEELVPNLDALLGRS